MLRILLTSVSIAGNWQDPGWNSGFPAALWPHSFSTAFLQLFHSFSTAFPQLFYSFSTAFPQLFYSFSTAFLQLFHSFSTAFLQLFHTRNASGRWG
jgi:hypothetical protein